MKNIKAAKDNKFPEDGFYALMPRVLLRANLPNGKNVSMGGRVLLALLLSYRSLPRITVSQQNMASQIGVSRQTISKYLKELRSAGLITSHRTGSTCQVEFTSVVNIALQRCKAQFTQVINNRNEKKKVYKTSILKKDSKNNNGNKEIKEEYYEWNV